MFEAIGARRLELDTYLRELTEHFGLSLTNPDGPERLVVEAKEWFERMGRIPVSGLLSNIRLERAARQ